MKSRRILALIGIAVASLMLVIGLPLLTTPSLAQSNNTLLISAAASLKEVMQ